jgi:hypothetical protein
MYSLTLIFQGPMRLHDAGHVVSALVVIDWVQTATQIGNVLNYTIVTSLYCQLLSSLTSHVKICPFAAFIALRTNLPIGIFLT